MDHDGDGEGDGELLALLLLLLTLRSFSVMSSERSCLLLSDKWYNPRGTEETLRRKGLG
mgnify:CR=1 FL=1